MGNLCFTLVTHLLIYRADLQNGWMAACYSAHMQLQAAAGVYGELNKAHIHPYSHACIVKTHMHAVMFCGHICNA